MPYLGYRLLLASHIVFVISWMAGILYLVRLLVYYREETEGVVCERLAVMAVRLYSFITLPAMILSLLFGLLMILFNPDLLHAHWMHAKLLLVVLLIGVTHMANAFRKKLIAGSFEKSGRFLRIFNEVPTLLMILIVFLVIVRPF